MKKSAILLFVLLPLLLCAQGVDSVKVVNYGVRASANVSQLVLHGIPRDIDPSPSVGVEGGAYLDFNIGRRFFVRFNALYSFQRSTLVMDGILCGLASSSVEIPVYAAWRFGGRSSGWGFVGVGPYTEFIVWGRLETEGGAFNPYHHVIDVDAITGHETFAMADSHSGFGVVIGYELPCGFFIDFTAQMALTDLLAFDHNDGMWVRPLKSTLGLGWRF